jgi:hypothetical protein
VFKSVPYVAFVSSAILLLGCTSTGGPGGFGSSSGDNGRDASSTAVLESGAENDAAQRQVNDSGGAGACTESDLAGLVGSSCANCVANSCSSTLQACTTTCAGCATSLISGCATCLTACTGGDAGASSNGPATDASGTTSDDASAASGDPCAKLMSCSGCTFVAAAMPAMQATCMTAVSGGQAAQCQPYLSGIQAQGFCP